MGRIFVTGGAGYVGSHACKRLAQNGHEVAVFDDLSRGHREFVKWGPLYEGSINDLEKLKAALQLFAPDTVIHFAALAYVGESIRDPYVYYRANVGGTLCLLEAMRQTGVSQLVLSSSCATYGKDCAVPIREDAAQRPINPYGVSKVMAEMICKDFDSVYGIKCVVLRYFNAAGADKDLEIGERHDPEPHLIPRLLMAANGELETFDVYGADYETSDGTCVRDFVHVDDLAEAHLAAANYLAAGGISDAFNLGSGRGHSVFEIIKKVEEFTRKSVPILVKTRREGDPAVLVADPSKAKHVLKWEPRLSDLAKIISSAWAWHCKDHGRRIDCAAKAA